MNTIRVVVGSNSGMKSTSIGRSNGSPIGSALVLDRAGVRGIVVLVHEYLELLASVILRIEDEVAMLVAVVQRYVGAGEADALEIDWRIHRHGEHAEELVV